MGSIASFLGLLSVDQLQVPLMTLPGLDAVFGNLMKWMDGWIGNLGWTVVLFTVFLKLITFPLDFFSRRSMKVYSLKMEKIQPQLEKLEKQYANNKQLLQQKKMAVQKKMGASALASCLPSIVTIALFFWVFAAFRSYIGYSSVETFNELATVHNNEIVAAQQENSEDGINITKAEQLKINEKIVERYKELSRNFLWVKNVALADVPWIKPPIPNNPSDFLKDVTDKNKENIDTSDYLKVMQPVIDTYVKDDGGFMVNGYLILPILAVGVSVLSQIVTQKTQKGAQAMNGNTGKGVMKVMMFIFPIMFLMFSLTSSTAFTIYMTVNSIITVLTTLLINVIVEHTVKLKERKEGPKAVGYRRDR